jgi:hypothetical protein
MHLQDFQLRRHMLMKRLDVTIQSFLWGEKAQGKEGEIAAAIRAQRAYLSEEPTKYTVNILFMHLSFHSPTLPSLPASLK